jgi:transposase-like protein
MKNSPADTKAKLSKKVEHIKEMIKLCKQYGSDNKIRRIRTQTVLRVSKRPVKKIVKKREIKVLKGLAKKAVNKKLKNLKKALKTAPQYQKKAI